MSFKCKKDISEVMKAIEDLTEAEALNKIRMSLRGTKTADAKSAPVYKISRWLNTHKLKEYETRPALINAIVKDTGMAKAVVFNLLNNHHFRLPKHLDRSNKSSSIKVGARPSIQVKPKKKNPDVKSYMIDRGLAIKLDDFALSKGFTPRSVIEKAVRLFLKDALS